MTPTVPKINPVPHDLNTTKNSSKLPLSTVMFHVIARWLQSYPFAAMVYGYPWSWIRLL